MNFHLYWQQLMYNLSQTRPQKAIEMRNMIENKLSKRFKGLQATNGL